MARRPVHISLKVAVPLSALMILFASIAFTGHRLDWPGKPAFTTFRHSEVCRLSLIQKALLIESNWDVVTISHANHDDESCRSTSISSTTACERCPPAHSHASSTTPSTRGPPSSGPSQCRSSTSTLCAHASQRCTDATGTSCSASPSCSHSAASGS